MGIHESLLHYCLFKGMLEDLHNEMFKNAKTTNKKNKECEGFGEEVLVLPVWVGRE